MDRNEAMLRELNLYPQWVRRNPPASDVVEQSEAASIVNVEPVVRRVPQPAVAVQAESVAPETSRLGGGEADTQRSAMDIATLSPNPSPASGRGEPVVTPAPEAGKSGWPELKQQVKGCTACKLRAGCTQTVFGVGDEKADWLFVGEGPGADEDARGEPFVGEAGKLLDNMLLAIKLKRGNNVYIANVVKCHPPGNRAPEPDEISACLPLLQRQIELIQPKLIVALGKVASNALLRMGDAEGIGHPSASPSRGLGKDATLASLRGTLHDYHGIPLVVTYHPAYLLRSPMEKAKAWQDLRLAVGTMSAAR